MCQTGLTHACICTGYAVVLYSIQKHGFQAHKDEFSNLVTFFTSLDSLSHLAMRLERAVSLWNTTALNATSVNSTFTYEFLKMQALSAVVGQIVTDGCNYVSWMLV